MVKFPVCIPVTRQSKYVLVCNVLSKYDMYLKSNEHFVLLTTTSRGDALHRLVNNLQTTV